MAASVDKPFWITTPPAQMSQQQWESLCDGCGKCCLHKLEDEDTGEIFHTDVACRYLGPDSRCGCYAQRTEKVAECQILRPEDLDQVPWLPATCAYRLIAEGQPLPAWHPLVSGDPDSVHRAGQSVRGRCVSEDAVAEDDYEDHIIHWV